MVGAKSAITRRRNVKKQAGLAMICCALAVLLAAPRAFAHMLWLNPSNQAPKVGETVDVGIGWGHTFPAGRIDQEVKDDAIEEITALDPDGQTVQLEQESKSNYKLKVEKEGVYLVSARIKPVSFSLTAEGRKIGDKKQVQNADKCTSFNMSAKALVVAGDGSKNLSTPTKLPLELVPLKNPASLKKGDVLPVKVTFNGEPLAGMTLKATHAGYEEPAAAAPAAEKPATTQGEASKGEAGKEHKGGPSYPFETVTDAKGEASIKLDSAGWQLVVLSHKTPYPDAEVCDESMYSETFTFEVK